MDEERNEQRLGYDATDRLRTASQPLEGVRSTNWVDAKGICVTCSHAIIQRRSSRNERVILCKELGHQRVAEDLAECSMHHTVTTLDLGQMAQIATLIDPRPDRYKGYI
jgi:hypothetical protein